MGKYSCPCLRPRTTGKRVRLPMPPQLSGRFDGLYWRIGTALRAFTRIERRRGGEDDGELPALSIPRSQRRRLMAIGAGSHVMLRAAARADAAGLECVKGLA